MQSLDNVVSSLLGNNGLFAYLQRRIAAHAGVHVGQYSGLVHCRFKIQFSFHSWYDVVVVQILLERGCFVDGAE